jgi:hypothetical protein
MVSWDAAHQMGTEQKKFILGSEYKVECDKFREHILANQKKQCIQEIKKNSVSRANSRPDPADLEEWIKFEDLKFGVPLGEGACGRVCAY